MIAAVLLASSCAIVVPSLPEDLALCAVTQAPSLPFGMLVEAPDGSVSAQCRAAVTFSPAAPGGECTDLDSDPAVCQLLGGQIGGCFDIHTTRSWLFSFGYNPPAGGVVFYTFETVF